MGAGQQFNRDTAPDIKGDDQPAQCRKSNIMPKIINRDFVEEETKKRLTPKPGCSNIR
jgi:hypothetical protein